MKYWISDEIPHFFTPCRIERLEFLDEKELLQQLLQHYSICWSTKDKLNLGKAQVCFCFISGILIIFYISCSGKSNPPNSRIISDHHGATLPVSLFTLCYSYEFNFSYFHPSVQFECLVGPFTRTGRVLFPQVCHSWRFECQTSPLCGHALHVCSPKSTTGEDV